MNNNYLDNKNGLYGSDEYLYSIDLILHYIRNHNLKPRTYKVSTFVLQLEKENWGNQLNKFTPQDVINNKSKYPDQYLRIIKSDISYPIIINEHNLIIDGTHRVAHALILGIKNINAYVIPTNLLNKFILGPNNSNTFSLYDSITGKELEKIYLQRFDNKLGLYNDYRNTYFILMIILLILLFILQKYFLL